MLGSPSLPSTVSVAQPPSLLLNDIPKQSRKAVCVCCPAKLKLTDFACGKCKNRFCMSHRLPEAHACTFDFKEEGKKLLEARNPVVTGSKLDKI
jgi:predicted nucleic acid binding AN1-type Zn finger protein